MTKRKPRADRYEEVLAAAAKVFSDLGYRAATIHRVASELDMTGAALYHYVESKEDLLVEICRRAGSRLHEAALETMARDLTPEEKLRALFHRHLEITLADRPIFTILLQERSELPSDRTESLLEGEREYFAIVRDLVEHFDVTGESRGQDPRLAALAMVGMLNWVLRWYREDGMLSLATIADQFFEIFAAGYLRSAVDRVPAAAHAAESSVPKP